MSVNSCAFLDSSVLRLNWTSLSDDADVRADNSWRCGRVDSILQPGMCASFGMLLSESMLTSNLMSCIPD